MIEKSTERVIQANQSLLRGVLGSSHFWDALTKGGIENTIRDLLLGEVAANVTSGNSQIFCAGERCYPGTKLRMDIGAFDSSKPRPVTGIGYAFVESIELKFNFDTQRGEFGRLQRDIGKLPEAVQKSVHGLVAIASIRGMSSGSAAVLRRYVRKPSTETINGICLALNQSNKNFNFRHLQKVNVRGSDPADFAEINFFVTW